MNSLIIKKPLFLVCNNKLKSARLSLLLLRDKKKKQNSETQTRSILTKLTHDGLSYQRNLTEEQLKRIEANRKRALERLQQKKKDAGEHVPSSTPKSTSTTTTKETGSYSPTKTLSQIVNSDSVQVLSKFVEMKQTVV